MLFRLELHLLQILRVINYSWDIPLLGDHKYKTLHKSSLLIPALSSCILTFKLQESEKFFFPIFRFQKREARLCTSAEGEQSHLNVSPCLPASAKRIRFSPSQRFGGQRQSAGARGQADSPRATRELPAWGARRRWIARAWCRHPAQLLGNSSAWICRETSPLVGAGPRYTVQHGDLGLRLIPEEERSVDAPHCKNGRKSRIAEPVWQGLAQLKWPCDMHQWRGLCGVVPMKNCGSSFMCCEIRKSTKQQSFVIIWLQD